MSFSEVKKDLAKRGKVAVLVAVLTDVHHCVEDEASISKGMATLKRVVFCVDDVEAIVPVVASADNLEECVKATGATLDDVHFVSISQHVPDVEKVLSEVEGLDGFSSDIEQLRMALVEGCPVCITVKHREGCDHTQEVSVLAM